MRVFVDAERLEEWAGDFAVRALSDQDQIDAIERASAEREAKRQALLTETASIETTLTELGGRLGRREITLARHVRCGEPLEERQRAIRGGGLASPTRAGAVPPGLRTLCARDTAWVDLLDRWDSGSSGERRAVVLRALNGRRLIVGRALRDGKLVVGK